MGYKDVIESIEKERGQDKNPAAEILVETTEQQIERVERLIAKHRARALRKEREEDYRTGQAIGTVLLSPLLVAGLAFGLALGAAAAVVTLPFTLPLAAIYLTFKAIDKVGTAIMHRRQDRARAEVLHEAELERIKNPPAEPTVAPEAEEPQIERNEIEIEPCIIKYDPADEDFERIGNQLSTFTANKGGPDYEPLKFAFKFVAHDGRTWGEVIGTTIWGHTEVNLLHVEEKFRGRGIGKKLLSLAEEFAKENGSRGIALFTPSFQGAGFYEKAGYAEAARLPLRTDSLFRGEPQYNILYEKSLEPDLVQASIDNDVKTIIDYAEQYPERVLAKFDDIVDANPDICEALTPFFTQTQFMILEPEDIKIRLKMKALPKQAVASFDLAMSKYKP